MIKIKYNLNRFKMIIIVICKIIHQIDIMIICQIKTNTSLRIAYFKKIST